jgi:pyruvate formate lyase activating enzyme
MLQADFAEAVLAGCRANEIHTAVETAGACAWGDLERLLRDTDLLLYDLKLIDDDAHRRWTGVSNGQVLENARRLRDVNVQVRLPLIPGITDTDANVAGIFRFMKDAGLTRAALLPYNPSSAAKYEWLGLPYEIEGETQDRARLEELARIGINEGIEVEIG